MVIEMKINWYPGHMKKTRELIQSNLKLVDVVIELLDARIPISSKNPVIDELIGQKPKVVILNKSDLSDQAVLKEWIAYYKERGVTAIPVNSITGQGFNRLIEGVKEAAKEKTDRMIAKGMKIRAIRVMIVGIPNVGKSSLINKLAGKNTAKVGNRPGVTKGKQWIRLRKDIDLFDTPGILWPKIDNVDVGLKLAFTGAIKDEILDIDTLCLRFLERMTERYPERIIERYKIEGLGETGVETMELIGKKRGCIISGGDIDYTKVSRIVMDEFRKGRLGMITLERPEDMEFVGNDPE